MARRSVESALAGGLAAALHDGHVPARDAARAHAARLREAWGELPDAAALQDAPDTPGWARGLAPAARLYVAEVTALWRALVAADAPARPWRTALPDTVAPLVGWLLDPPRDVKDALQAARRAWGPCPDPYADVAQGVLVGLLPASHRHAIGLHPTPEWMARRVVTWLGDEPAAGMLDPACGTGVFLLAWLRAAAEREGTSVQVTGVETSPLIAAAARVAAERAAAAVGGTTLATIHEADLLCDLRVSPDAPPQLRAADGLHPLPPVPLVLGNPPWVAWDRLPAGYKAKLAPGPLAALDAFDRHGFEAQLGAANDDVSALFAQIALAHLVAPRGRLVFLLKWNLVSNETARVLRRFEVRWRPESGFRERVPYAVERLVDLRRCNPFHAAVEPALWQLRRDQPMGRAMPAETWRRRRGHGVEVAPSPPYTPVERDKPEGPWAPGSTARQATRSLEGTFGWDIRHGLKHDCNGVFLLALEGDAADGTVRARNRPRTSRRISVPPWEGALEPRFLRPLVQSRYLRPFTLTGWSHVLAPVADGKVLPEAALREAAPLTHAYLEASRAPLAARRSRVFAQPPFYRLFGVGPYNDATALVVWSGMGFRPWFAVIDHVRDPLLGRVRPLPDGSCYLIPLPSADEAHYLVGLLNAPAVRAFLQSRSSGSKRGLSRAVLSRLQLPAFVADDPDHAGLAKAAAAVARYGDGVAPPSDEERADVDARADRLLR